MSKVGNQSTAHNFRWISQQSYDVDAFLLTDLSWLLFVYLKKNCSINHLKQKFIDEFQILTPVYISGALKTPNLSSPLDSDAPKTPLWTKEGQINLRLEAHQVLNPGLFLDQADNRMLLQKKIKQQNSTNQTLLNLFCYTGSFSCIAAANGVSTVNIDVSKRYLKWAKENIFAQSTHEGTHRFFTDDTRSFLKRQSKKNAQFDWIILDPPTFSRKSKLQKSTFHVQKDLFAMLEFALHSLKSTGEILVSHNDAQWSSFKKEIRQFALQNHLSLETTPLPQHFPSTHSMQCFWISKSRK